ncbi:MAG: nuclear transport factor 2 family protein, partial [Solirubrobacterales bacterium]
NPGPHFGRQAIQRRIQEQREPFEELIVQPEDYFESGDKVVAIITTRGKPRGASAEIEARVGHLWTIRDGKVVSVRLFPKREQALEAAGLPE